MILDIVGWIGMILVLAAYILLSLKKIENGKLYQILNFVASILMIIALYPKDAWFSVVLNVIWSIVALIALIKLRK